MKVNIITFDGKEYNYEDLIGLKFRANQIANCILICAPEVNKYIYNVKSVNFVND